MHISPPHDADNSGVLSYVRIEFAGYPFQTDQEINGLTLGSVGSGTKIDHVQVSYSESSSLSLIDACGVGSPFMPSAASPLLTLASYDGEASWFDKVVYVGAFSATDNWLNGWTSFDPQNENY